MAGKSKDTTVTEVSDEIEESMDRTDRIIRRNIGKKPISEIAQMCGMRPEEVLRRKDDLINGTDVLTLHERRMMRIFEVEEIASETIERARSASDEFSAGHFNSAIAALKTSLTELNRLESKNSDALERLNQKRVTELLRLVDAVVVSTVKEISEQYNLDSDELMEIFQEKLVIEARAIEGSL